MVRQAYFIVARYSYDEWCTPEWELSPGSDLSSGHLETTEVLACLSDLSEEDANAITEALQMEVSDWVRRPILSAEPEAVIRKDLAHYLVWSRRAEERAEGLRGTTRDQWARNSTA